MTAFYPLQQRKRGDKINPIPPILIIDNEPGMLKLFTAICQREGHQVTGALRGTHALTKVQQKTPRLVLLDLKLPGMSGIDVIHFIRQSPDLQHVKVIVITAAPWLIRELQDGEADMVFTKPIKPTQLLDAITKLL